MPSKNRSARFFTIEPSLSRLVHVVKGRARKRLAPCRNAYCTLRNCVLNGKSSLSCRPIPPSRRAVRLEAGEDSEFRVCFQFRKPLLLVFSGQLTVREASEAGSTMKRRRLNVKEMQQVIAQLRTTRRQMPHVQRPPTAGSLRFSEPCVSVSILDRHSRCSRSHSARTRGFQIRCFVFSATLTE